MKKKISLRLLCAFLVVAILCTSLPLSVFAEEIAAITPKTGGSNTVKNVTVSTFDELKKALEADDNAVITLENDITKDIRPFVFINKYTAEEKNYDPYEDFDEGEYDIRFYDGFSKDGFYTLDGESVEIYEDPQIKIKGEKVLNLNGYSINVLDNSNVAFSLRNLTATSDFYRHTLVSSAETYHRTLLTVTNGSELTIRDNTANPGTIHYDAWMITTPSEEQIHYVEYAVRDIVSVEDATLIVENGVLEAGRSKEQWIVDGSRSTDDMVEDDVDNNWFADDEYIKTLMHNGYAYQQVWGSAIHLASKEAEVYIYNGSFFGRGLGGESVVAEYDKDGHVTDYVHTGAFRDAVIDGARGTVVIYGGFFNAKGGADIFYFDRADEQFHNRYYRSEAADVTIRGGSFRIQKVDYIRCLDANMTNDTDASAWISAGAGAIGGMLLAAFTMGAGASLIPIINFASSVGWATAGMAAGAGGIAALLQSPVTPIVLTGEYGRMNIKKEYLEDINGARFTVDYDKDDDGDIDGDMTVFDYVPDNNAEDFGVFLRIDLKADNSYDWSESGLGIKNAFVNGEARTDGEIVPVKLKDGNASIKFEWNGLSENLEKAGCKLYPVVQYYLGETKGLHPYEIVDNSAIITTPLSYEGQKSTFKFDLYLLMPNGKRANIGSHTVVVSVEKEEIGRVSISLDTLVGGTTPANYEGKVNTTGVSIAEEAWYEYNDGSLKKMNDSDKFVAGNQYVYGVTFAFDSGYKFNPFTTVSINGIAARKSGDYFHWTSAVMTAKAELTATTPNDTVTVIKGDTVTLKVNATGDGLEYVWQGDETVGAPSVGVNFRDNITLECVNAGTYTYKCIVKDANGNKETVTFTVTVIASNMSGTVLPAEPVFNGEGFIGVEDSDNITVTKNGSIVLKPDFTFGNSGAIGEISYTWEIYDASYKKLGNITTENLVITADSEIINSKTVGTYVIMLSIKNTAGGVHNSMFTGATVYVVEPESTGNLGGQIGSEQEQAIPYAMRRMSARSANNFEGTIVYLVKDEAIVYVTEADAQGYYMFTNIPYGSYSVKVEKEGYENYSKDVEVNQADNDCDITIIKHVCFADEGNEMSIPAKQPNCEMGELGNIECRGCISCGKFYDMEGNLIADSAADPGSLNDMGIPYAALLYPVHDYCGEAQEGGNADQYLRHRAETCLEETTYWYYCINGNCKKSAGDDPSAVDKYYVGSASNQTHIFTKQIAEDYYHYDFHELGVDGKENCKQKIWYYHACEYCGAKGNTVWESDTYGAHDYSDFRAYQPEIHTATELKGAVAQHHFCHICDTYLSGSLETTLEALTSTAPSHSYTNEYGYKGADGHANTCSCGAKDTVEGHTPDRAAATQTQPIKCTKCQYIITPALGHTTCSGGIKQNGQAATCTTDGWNDYYKCSGCNKIYTDAACTPANEITDLAAWKTGAGKIAAAHTYGDWKTDADKHWKECSCGKKADEGNHVDANSNNKCDSCDKTLSSGGVTPPPHTHDYGTTWKFDGTNHWHECSCGDKKEVTAHSGGTATCEAKAKCSECNTEYGELAEHKYSEATCTAKAKCSVCGDEKGELAAHTYVDGKCACGATDPNYQLPHEHNFVEGKCECGETDPNYQPPHEHTFVEGKCECGETDPNYVPPHTHTFVEGKCECGETDPNYVPPHEHTFVEGKCECGETDPNYVPPHEHNFVEGKCECGETDPNYVPGNDDPQTPDDPQIPDDNDGLGTGAIVGIVIGAVVVLGGGGFALYWFVIRKKLAATAPAAPADVDPASDSENEEKTE